MHTLITDMGIAILISTADMPEHIPTLEKAGANHVVLSYSLAGKMLVDEIAVISRDELNAI